MSGRTKLQIVPDPELVKFLEDSIPALTAFETVTHKCPHCEYPVMYPLIVNEGHVQTLQLMLDAASKYLRKHGVMAEMLAEIRANCIIEIARRKNER